MLVTGSRVQIALSRTVAAGALLVLAPTVGGCSADAERDPVTPVEPAATRAEGAPPSDETTTAAEEPLALAVSASRGPHNVTAKAARRLLSAGVSTWSRLGQGRGRVRVVSGGLPVDTAPGAQRLGSAAAALRAARRDDDTLALVPAHAVDPRVQTLTVGGVSPLRHPERYPLQVATGRTPGTVVTLAIGGDLMLGRRVGDLLERRGDPYAVLRPMARRFRAADIAVANLESTLSTAGPPQQGGDSFAADPAVLSALRRTGFDAVTLANNHVGDFGERALRQTLTRLERSPLESFGAGRDLARASRPLVVEVDGVRTGFIGFDSIGESPAATASAPGTNRLDMPPRTGPLDRAALRRIAADVRSLSRRVDTVVVMPHWGTQYTHVPEPSQRRVARVLARAGADLVAGGHPHWVQGWEAVGDTVVVHSLGNLVFDMDFSPETQEGVLLEVVTWDGELKAVEPVPYVIGPDFAPRLAAPARAEAILELVWATSRGPFRAAS